MTSGTHPSEMAFFSVLASSAGLGAAARTLGITTPAVSKRLAQMEARLGVALVIRTTRRMHLTPEGETYLAHARSEEHTSELQSLMRISYAVFCLQKKTYNI